jgi:hypothetical protein
VGIRLTARSEGSTTEEEVTPNKIKSVHINFMPSRALRERDQTVRFCLHRENTTGEKGLWSEIQCATVL